MRALRKNCGFIENFLTDFQQKWLFLSVKMHFFQKKFARNAKFA